MPEMIFVLVLFIALLSGPKAVVCPTDQVWNAAKKQCVDRLDDRDLSRGVVEPRTPEVVITDPGPIDPPGPPSNPPGDDKPGHGYGDPNHGHSGPPGQDNDKGKGKK